MNDKQEFVCEHCGKTRNPKEEYHRTFNVCNADCYMEMVGLSWGDFISHYY